MSYKKVFDTYNFEEVKKSIYSKTEADVRNALTISKRTLEDFKALISPAALPYLEQMAALSRSITQKRFGKTIQMYVPMYLSNECQNICTYCGFSLHNKIKRTTLTNKQIIQEAEAIKKMGFEHLLIVTGESTLVETSYMVDAISILRNYFSQISIEVQPLDTEDYIKTKYAGVNGVFIYQETYNNDNYRLHHTKGKKSNFYYRLETPDRIGKALIHKIGLGVLLGLEDWRTDSFFTALHLNYLEKKYWQTKYSISFPRLRPAQGVIEKEKVMNDKELVQLICAYRIFNEELELSLSTRESESFRNNLLQLGITSMSAGSKTNPGGYSLEQKSLEQFEINDDRSPAEIAEIIKKQGYEPVWKDWDKIYNSNII